MSIFFPDNDNRTARLTQLGSNAQDFLFEAQKYYEEFEKLLPEVNTRIADAYKAANLKAPEMTSIDILKAAGNTVAVDNKLFAVSKILLDIAGLVLTVKYLAPGATKALVASGLMAEETAARILAEFTLPFCGKQVSIEAGELAGAIVGGIVGGAIIVGLDLGLDAIEGVIARDKLRDGVNKVFPIRNMVKISEEKAATLLNSLRAIKATFDALEGTGIELTEKIILNLIQKDAKPSIDAAAKITTATIAADLLKMDAENKAWVNEDPHE